MGIQKRIEDYGIVIGSMEKGRLNKITDVSGVKVGHCTIDTPQSKTGVTIIIPSALNVFTNKLVAAAYVLNGYGKTMGLIQIDELGLLETPIALTNTLNVGLVHDAMVEYMIGRCKADNVKLFSVNPIVCDCNDSLLNNIYLRAVHKEHVFNAIDHAEVQFLEGDIGAGKGLICHSLKGGIGSSSRVIRLGDEFYTLGVLVQSNHGLLKDLRINGESIGEKINRQKTVELADKEDAGDKGSIVIILATDLPLSDRQLKRILKRTSVGIARLGSFMGNGSGEVMVGFSTANSFHYKEKRHVISMNIIEEGYIDLAFRAAAEACEEAILNSMVTANKTVFHDRTINSLSQFLK